MRHFHIGFGPAHRRRLVEAELAGIEFGNLGDPLAQRLDSQQPSLHVCEAAPDRVHFYARLRLNLFELLALTVQATLPFVDDLAVEQFVAEKARDDENISDQTRDDEHCYGGEGRRRNSTRLGATALFSEEYDLHRFF